MENSITHSEDGSRIRIQTEASESEVICEVSDEGSGYSQEALKNLFKMLSPGEPHIDQNKGLSLSLVKLILDAHKAKIEVRNKDNKGATVGLTLRRNLD